MSTAEKFNFESLHVPGEPAQGASAQGAPSTRRKRAYTQAQIESLQQAAFEDGEAAGLAAALQRIENAAVTAFDQFSAQYGAILPDIDAKVSTLQAQSAELALSIAKVLAPALLAREPLAEIEALFRECAAHLQSEPRLVFRVDETLVEPMAERIDTLAVQSGYPGRIVLIGDPGLNAGECQIEWVDGGAVHGSREQLTEIEEIIARYVAATGAPANAPGSGDDNTSEPSHPASDPPGLSIADGEQESSEL